MGARRRVAPLVLILALVALCLALVKGPFTESDGSTAGRAFVESDARTSVVVWAVGDGPDGGPGAAAVARLITKSKPDRVLYLGDVYERGTAREFAQNFDPAYGAIAGRIAPTPGNHDWPQHADGYDPYWQRTHGKAVPEYYSFRSGGWQLISLNSEIDHDPGSAQLAWLRSKATAKGNCRLAFWHRPRYSAGDRHGDDPGVQPFWDALVGHARIVVNGHEHDMQRFVPRHGITEFVSGAGGHGRYGLHKRRDLAFGSTRFGALRLALARGIARYRFVSVQGRTLDSGKVRCKAG
jgi:hypothetical protein